MNMKLHRQPTKQGQYPKGPPKPDKELADTTVLLRRLRHLMGWSQKDLGDHLGLSLRTVQSYESGHRPAPKHRVVTGFEAAERVLEQASTDYEELKRELRKLKD